MNRWAMRVAYFGESYYGFQRQPNLPTVEGKLLNALHQADLVDLGTLRDHHYANAARTDRGVNALEQTIAFNAVQTPNLNQINAYLPNSIFIWAMSEVPQTFHPRNSCHSKTYEYYHYDRTSNLDLVAMRKSGEILKGTHNFRNFARYDPKRNQDFVRTISSLEVIRNGPLLIFRFVGKSFLWEQCRRIVSHLLEVGLGVVAPEEPNETKSLLSGEINMVKPTPAPPDGLLLCVVEYKGIAFHSNSFTASKKSQFLNVLCREHFKRYQVANAVQRRISNLS